MARHNTQILFSSLAPRASQLIVICGKQIALFRLEEAVYAIDELCPHRDAPMHTGTWDGDAIICPWHQWRFRLKDGVCTNIPGVKTRSYAVHLIEDQIWIETPD